VAYRLERWTCDREVVGLTPGRVAIKWLISYLDGWVTASKQLNHLVIITNTMVNTVFHPSGVGKSGYMAGVEMGSGAARAVKELGYFEVRKFLDQIRSLRVPDSAKGLPDQWRTNWSPCLFPFLSLSSCVPSFPFLFLTFTFFSLFAFFLPSLFSEVGF